MAEISVSLNVVGKIDRHLPMAGGTTLAQVQAGFKNYIPSLSDALLIVSYRVNQHDTALYELGVRTGDVLTLVTDEMPSSSGLSLKMIRPSVDVLEVSDNATVGDILRELSKIIHKPAQQLYIGRYAANLDFTLDDYELKEGDLVSLALLPTSVNYELQLVPARGAFAPIHVTATSGGVMGGADNDIDISHILPRRKRHLIQGAQAEFIRINDVWHIQALPSANMPLFVDGHRLFPRRPKALFENNVISLGSSPNDPLLQLVVQFDME